jgi:mannitol 2-dehydrogenase
MGYRKVDEAIGDPLLRAFVRRYMDRDVTPTLPPVPHLDVEAYKDQLLERFANPAISDQVERLAKDGAAKIAVYLVPVLARQLATGGSITHLAFALAAWARYLSGHDERGDEIAIDDPVWVRVQRPIAHARDLLGVPEVFGLAPASDQRLVAAVDEDLRRINEVGVRAALTELLGR